MYNRLKDDTHNNGNLADGRKTETTDLSSTPMSNSCYGSTSLKDESVPVRPSCVPWCGLIFYVVACFGLFASFLLREGLSVAIVAMVNHTAVADKGIVVMSNFTEDQCPRDPELQYEDGEFNWDRNQQGIILAAYFYGNGFIKVL